MPLFDAYGRPIHPNPSSIEKPPPPKRQDQSPKPSKIQLATRAIRKLVATSKILRHRWESAIAILAFAIAIYALRPILTASLVSTPTGADKTEAELTIANSGHIPITDVEVLCQWNKAVFGGRYTFVMNGLVTLSVHSSSRLSPGESITTFCWQPWELYINRAEGVFSLGRPDIPQRLTVGVDFTFPNGPEHPVLTHPHDVVQLWVPDLSIFDAYPMTAIDAVVVVKYRVFGVKRLRAIHLVSDDLGQIVWKIMPEGVTISDGNGGFKVSSAGRAVTVTMDRVAHPNP